MIGVQDTTTVAIKEETLLERAVRIHLKRLNLKRAIIASHRTAGTAPMPIGEPQRFGTSQS